MNLRFVRDPKTRGRIHTFREDALLTLCGREIAEDWIVKSLSEIPDCRECSDALSALRRGRNHRRASA